MRLLHVVAFSKKLRWLDQTKVITLKFTLNLYILLLIEVENVAKAKQHPMSHTTKSTALSLTQF